MGTSSIFLLNFFYESTGTFLMHYFLTFRTVITRAKKTNKEVPINGKYVRNCVKILVTSSNITAPTIKKMSDEHEEIAVENSSGDQKVRS